MLFQFKSMSIVYSKQKYCHALNTRGRCGHDCMVVGFNTTYAISAYHH